MSPLLDEPTRIDEPSDSSRFSEVLTHVATSRQAIIVRRAGEDLAAVIPLKYLELLREAAATREAEEIARHIEWEQARESRPPQTWFDGEEPKPF
jgi:hypothetical protein